MGMQRGVRVLIVVGVVVAAIGIPLLLKHQAAAGGALGAPGGGASHGTLPRFVDLGTTTCAPCKAMLRVMQELGGRFPGKLEIQFINVHEQPERAESLGVSVIPSQIFYSPDQRELFRHKGFFSADEVVAKWKELGYDLAGPAKAPGGR